MQNPNENNLPIIQQNNLQVVDNQLTITGFLLAESEEIAIKKLDTSKIVISKDKIKLTIDESERLLNKLYELSEVVKSLEVLTIDDFIAYFIKKLRTPDIDGICVLESALENYNITMDEYWLELWANKLPPSLDKITAKKIDKIEIVVGSYKIGKGLVLKGYNQFGEWQKELAEKLKDNKDDICKVCEYENFEDFANEIWNSELPSSVDAERRNLSEIATLQLQKKSKIKFVLPTENLFQQTNEKKSFLEFTAEQQYALLSQAFKIGKAALNLGVVTFKDFSSTIKENLGNDFILLVVDSREDKSFENYLKEVWETKLPRSLDTQRRSLAEIATEKIINQAK